MLKYRMLPSKTYQSIPRHNLFYANISSPFLPSPTPYLPISAVTYQTHYYQLISSTKAHSHATHQITIPGQLEKVMSELQTETGSNPSSTEDWKSQPPYRTTPGNSHFDKKWTAHCHCGRVKYWLSRDKPLASKFCHCIDCQALHGAPFQWAAIFEKTDLHFERGVEGLAFYHSPDQSTVHKLPCKVSCAYCHSPIMDEGRRMVLMFPGIIEFGDAEHKRLFDPQ
ncbi:Mss4-like protein [Annulohypoxylon bovei var. microspora]|nr:Mss4-like protein [Annulohypoxylon bovei var. microspora]